MKMFFSLLIISFSFIMFFLSHPLSMGMMILIQTFLTCIILGMLIKTYWFSYILFLTFLGGLLVLFIYVSSIASNEMFNLSFKMKNFFFMIMLINLIISMNFIYNIQWMNFINNLDMINFFNSFLFFNNEYKINISKLYNSQTFLMMMMMIIYLFITLVAVVKITNIFFGPLRSSF
uniref:NADH-ubiquinone oxidoreductase chain 6 n=1 Tax=Helcystogramma macroscopa TaxID=1604231 RepID=A0A142ID85_9NEOP|nr:NADH dehydrogenase subunit 6 [Helcystogramma macroscopa]AJF22798.1 NADH dehydrogenase subunit 6 [Helcystogramma macroscopa]AMR57163.1 NADH dehydrogenase subunit 6 [Helcystogramma macroscopa]